MAEMSIHCGLGKSGGVQFKGGGEVEKHKDNLGSIEGVSFRLEEQYDL